MTVISSEDFNRVCQLAKLAIPEGCKEQFLNKLNSVFEWIDQLKKIDTSTVETMFYSDVEGVIERADIPCSENTKEEIFSNAKNKKFDMFCVPKIVE